MIVSFPLNTSNAQGISNKIIDGSRSNSVDIEFHEDGLTVETEVEVGKVESFLKMVWS